MPSLLSAMRRSNSLQGNRNQRHFGWVCIHRSASNTLIDLGKDSQEGRRFLGGVKIPVLQDNSTRRSPCLPPFASTPNPRTKFLRKLTGVNTKIGEINHIASFTNPLYVDMLPLNTFSACMSWSNMASKYLRIAKKPLVGLHWKQGR